jgi:hypothetical protein
VILFVVNGNVSRSNTHERAVSKNWRPSFLNEYDECFVLEQQQLKLKAVQRTISLPIFPLLETTQFISQRTEFLLSNNDEQDMDWMWTRK